MLFSIVQNTDPRTKRFTALAIILCVSGLAAGNAQVHDNIARRPVEEAFSAVHWISYPSEGSITVVGIAGRKSRRDEAIADALKDAARRVSLYLGVYGESRTVFSQGTNNVDYFADTEYSLTIHNSAESCLDALIFDKEQDVFEKNGAVFVRARYPGVIDIPARRAEPKETIPVWVREHTPDIPGFLVSVGIAKNKGSPQKTYQASYENAIVSLLPRLSVRIEHTVIDAEGGKTNHAVSSSTGSLEKIVILETWLDVKTSSVWTLLAGKADG